MPVMKRIEGAGGVVFGANDRVLMIRYPGGSWDFPKGHIDPGETRETAAMREVLEEGGVTARIERRLEPTEYTNPRGEARRIHWFLMRTLSEQAIPEPGFEAGFFPVQDALKKLTHPETRALLLEAAAFLTAPVQE